MSTVSLGGAVISNFLGKSQLRNLEEDLLHPDGLTRIFRKHHVRDLAEGDESAVAVWERVMPQLLVALETIGLDNVQRVSSSELGELQDILAIEVPRLRRLAAPASGSQSIGRGASASLAQRIEEYARDI